MGVVFFKAVRCPGDWELNLVGKRLNIRIARSQFAIWWDMKPVISRRFGFTGIDDGDLA